LGYAKPFIYTGTNLEDKIEKEKMASQGYEVFISKPDNY